MSIHRAPAESRIAVVGAGLAGLAAAWWLGRAGHAVTLFERQPRPGFTSQSVGVTGRGGQAVRIDVPLRVFYPGYYPTLLRLYAELGVLHEAVSYASSFQRADGQLYFRYRNLRLGAWSVGTMAPADLLLGAPARRIGLALLRFGRQVRHALARGELEGTTVGEWVAAQGHPDDFVEGFLLPAIATICTCSHAQARAFPATVIADYVARGLVGQSVRRALHGADDVQQRLLAGIADLRCNARLRAVRRAGAQVLIESEDGPDIGFDHVVLATQANQARRLLADASADEAPVLDGFRYTPVQVLTHRDAGFMPVRRRDWSPVNLRLSDSHAQAESTIWINAVQPALRDADPVFQTVHPQREPGAGMLLGRAAFERPLVDAGSQRALRALQALHDEPGRRLWFCGSYAQAGVPLLESAVRSAWSVVLRLGAGQGGRVAANKA